MNILPKDKVYWYEKDHAKSQFNELTENLETDVLIIGGGMSGLSAAQVFKERGLNVVLVEKDFCGAGASGKSSGFITPNSEYSLSQIAEKLGSANAKKLWDFVTDGANFIHNNIKKYNLECDYEIQDTLTVADSFSKFTEDIVPEYNIRKELGYETQIYNSKAELKNILNSDKYYGAISYSGSFGINSYKYCQSMAKELEKLGTKIFEKTEAIKIENWGILTNSNYSIKAKYIIVCLDRFLPELNKIPQDVYHAQTFLMASNMLTKEQVNLIFPQKKYMCWDSDLIYQYWRLTHDNRLLIGGSNVLYTYAKNEIHNSSCIFKKLDKYIKTSFPELKIDFEYMWPGMIGLTKDILPIAGPDRQFSNIYYIAGAAGLAWCAKLGDYSSQKILDHRSDYDQFFDPYRSYPVNSSIQRIIGTKLTFALSNFLSTK